MLQLDVVSAVFNAALVWARDAQWHGARHLHAVPVVVVLDLPAPQASDGLPFPLACMLSGVSKVGSWEDAIAGGMILSRLYFWGPTR